MQKQSDEQFANLVWESILQGKQEINVCKNAISKVNVKDLMNCSCFIKLRIYFINI